MEVNKADRNTMSLKQMVAWGLAVTALSGYVVFAAHDDVRQQNNRDAQYSSTLSDTNEHQAPQIHEDD